MNDRERIVQVLKDQIALCGPDPERDRWWVTFTADDARRILEWLKEPIEPEKEHSGSGMTWWNVCGACKTAINPNDKYCHECGQAVKWDA